jgi:predicted ABC-class ATPase
MLKKNGAILETLRRIEDNQASMDRDMEKDRQGLQDLTIRLEAVESELKQVRKALNLNVERIKEKVAEAVKPATEATKDLTTEIKDTKTVIFGEPKKSWWQKFLDVWSRG